MELKMHTPTGNLFSEKKKKLHYIQHGFICQWPGLSEDQTMIIYQRNFHKTIGNIFLL